MGFTTTSCQETMDWTSTLVCTTTSLKTGQRRRRPVKTCRLSRLGKLNKAPAALSCTTPVSRDRRSLPCSGGMFRAARVALREKSRLVSWGLVNGSYSTAPNPQRLAGKVALITGAASGIGRATAAEFVRHGAKVILADVQDDLGRVVAAELGPDAAYTRCDVADEAQIAAAVDLAVERHGHLDILYSNAGVSGSTQQASVGALDLDDFDRVMALNARSAVACIKHGARVMSPARCGGCILCTASVLGVLSFGSPILAYAVSKATVIAAVRAAAGPLARDGVRVNAVSPHAIATPMTVRSMAEMFPDVGEETLRRVVEEDWSELGGNVLAVEDVARAALYLASDEARYVTGHNLLLDGGFTAHKGVSMPSLEAPIEPLRRDQ